MVLHLYILNTRLVYHMYILSSVRLGELSWENLFMFLAIVTYPLWNLMFFSFFEISPANAFTSKIQKYCCCFSVREEKSSNLFVEVSFFFYTNLYRCSTKFLQRTHYLFRRGILLLIYCTILLPFNYSFLCYLSLLLYYPAVSKKRCISMILFSRMLPVVG